MNEMEPREIGCAYNKITHLWQDDEFNLENGIEQHLRALNFVKNKRKALDVGCGRTGRIIELLQENGFEIENIEGVDISASMIELAQKKHPQAHFHQQDICEWEVVDKYDFISAWDSIWHIPLSQQEKVLTKLISSLNQGGVFILSCGGTDEAGDHRDSTMGPEVYYSTLGLNGFINLFISLGCRIRHLEFDQPPELHTYFVIQKIN